MPFLEKLRMNNIFPRNPASDRPFGMPEIDDGEFGPMMHQAQGYARTANNEADQRQKEMMKFEFDLKNSSRPQPGGIAGSRLTQMMTRPGSSAPAVQGGFSPMQRMFQERDAADRARKEDQDDTTTKFRQAMQMKSMDQGGDIDLQNLRGEQESNQIEQRGGMDQTAANIKMRHDRELASARNAAETEQIKQRQTYELSQIAARGTQDRMTQAEKPPVGAANDPMKQIAARVQSLAIDAPALATMVDTQPDGQFRINPKASPQQIQAIRQYMMGQQPSAPAASVPAATKARDNSRRKGAPPLSPKPADRTNQVTRR